MTIKAAGSSRIDLHLNNAFNKTYYSREGEIEKDLSGRQP
jgi:hypothetical protein